MVVDRHNYKKKIRKICNFGRILQTYWRHETSQKFHPGNLPASTPRGRDRSTTIWRHDDVYRRRNRRQSNQIQLQIWLSTWNWQKKRKKRKKMSSFRTDFTSIKKVGRVVLTLLTHVDIDMWRRLSLYRGTCVKRKYYLHRWGRWCFQWWRRWFRHINVDGCQSEISRN